jgi:topoisomerase-like DNA binding C4 zinc finger protein
MASVEAPSVALSCQQFGAKPAANVGMAHAQLDQFIYALVWKAGPVIVLCGVGAVVLRELLRRIGRRAARNIHETRPDQKTLNVPHCPSCTRPMVKRTVRRGPRAGSEFWGCSNYPACTDTRTLSHLAS